MVSSVSNANINWVRIRSLKDMGVRTGSGGGSDLVSGEGRLASFVEGFDGGPSLCSSCIGRLTFWHLL